ncbi:MAG: L,D-transpeptidase family protein [Bacteroidia bacterium]
MTRYLIIVLLAGATFMSCKRTDHPDNQYQGREIAEEDISAVIQTVIDSHDISGFFPYQLEDTVLFNAMKSFYRAREYELAWNEDDELLPQTEEFIAILEDAEKEGLEREDYDIRRIKMFRDDVFESDEFQKNMKLIYLDLMLTANYILYAHHTVRGRIDPGTLGGIWKCTPRECDLAANLRAGIEEQNIAASLDSLKPQYRQFRKLKGALSLYRAIIMTGGWDTVPQGPELAVGDTSVRVAAAWKRLNAEINRSEKEKEVPQIFDRDLESTLKYFQKRHGLEESGKLDEATVRVMNIPATDRTNQIKLNIERLRWLPDSFGSHYILVNIPEYKMRVVENGNEAMEMRVIVGKKMNSTPIFSDTMEYLVFAPYWNVPNSIATEEILPKQIENSSYLAEHNYELLSGWGKDASVVHPIWVNWKKMKRDSFKFRIRQKPGPWNALGHVKFIFPNDMDIYLHDTPTDHLFSRAERDFSHGCIRIEEPAKLADFLLPDKDTEEIEELMAAENETVVPLKKQYPVHILYWTTWVDDDGKVNFRDDLYDFDQVQLNAIERHRNRDLDLISER